MDRQALPLYAAWNAYGWRNACSSPLPSSFWIRLSARPRRTDRPVNRAVRRSAFIAHWRNVINEPSTIKTFLFAPRRRPASLLLLPSRETSSATPLGYAWRIREFSRIPSAFRMKVNSLYEKNVLNSLMILKIFFLIIFKQTLQIKVTLYQTFYLIFAIKFLFDLMKLTSIYL